MLGWATGVFLLIGVLGVGWYVIVWRVERYIVTTRRVIETGGVINKWSRDTSLEMITDMIVDHPAPRAHLRLRRDRPSRPPPNRATNKIRFLPDPDGFKKALLDAKQEHALELAGGGKGRRRGPGSSRDRSEAAREPGEPRSRQRTSAEEVDASLTRLADMRDRGLITQAEFDEKKKQLLDRI